MTRTGNYNADDFTHFAKALYTANLTMYKADTGLMACLVACDLSRAGWLKGPTRLDTLKLLRSGQASRLTLRNVFGHSSTAMLAEKFEGVYETL